MFDQILLSHGTKYNKRGKKKSRKPLEFFKLKSSVSDHNGADRKNNNRQDPRKNNSSLSKTFKTGKREKIIRPQTKTKAGLTNTFPLTIQEVHFLSKVFSSIL